jgi:carbonic anhydrase
MTKFNPASLLPSVHTHYQYSGSLTTPPCSEGVNWTVLNTPMPISEEQLAQFHRAYVHNNRPLQELHERHPASF